MNKTLPYKHLCPRNDIALAVLGTGTNTWYEGWIPCGLLHDEGDAGEKTAFTNITDNATQYGMLSIYKINISDTHTSVPFFIYYPLWSLLLGLR